ncbi:MAG: hypothetical protein JNG84_14215 [Archangium sp.]|nr:hypothetical protein [Archangium sp.]
MNRQVLLVLGAGLALFGCSTACATTAGLAPEADSDSCIGPRTARAFVVYLHGVDSPEPGPLEQQNREALTRAGQALSIRFALPRATQACGNGTVCWGPTGDRPQRQAAAQATLEAASRCFPPKAKYGVLGFSSGGYLVLRWLRACEFPTELPRVEWSVAVGSSMLRGALERTPEDLSRCGRVTLFNGTRDGSNDPDGNYLKQLEAKRADVSLVEYPGGHELPGEALIDLLARHVAISRR